MVGSIWPGKRPMFWALIELFRVKLYTFDWLNDRKSKKLIKFKNLSTTLIFLLYYRALAICMEIAHFEDSPLKHGFHT